MVGTHTTLLIRMCTKLVWPCFIALEYSDDPIQELDHLGQANKRNVT